jgi:hypothetical protein
MADAPINVQQVQNAGDGYIVPASLDLILKCARCAYDGSGAAGDFVPLLQIFSDAGLVVAECRAEETVVAGGSADVTWFPALIPPRASATAAALPSFANTTFNVTIDDNPIDLNSGTATMHFSSSDGTFDTAGGQARITRPGLYVIGLQIEVENIAPTVGDTGVELQLGYGPGPSFSSIGYGIEVPWLGFDLATEQILGTFYIYPNGAAAGRNIALQRLHPISVDADLFPDYPLEIHGLIYCADTSGIYVVRNFALWGYRLGDALDSFHSD